MTTMNEIDWDCLSEIDLSPTSKAYNNRELVPASKNTSELVYTSNVKLLDIEEAKKLLPWEKIEEFKEQTSNFEVVTYNECEQALSMVLQSRKLSKAVEKKRKDITKPHLDFQKGVKKIADAFIDELKSIEASMAEKVETFNKARKDKSEEIGIDLTTVDNVDDGTSYIQEYWEFEISEIKDVPKEYLKIDDKKVKQALSNGVRNIPGLRIFKTSKQRYRVK